jgi:hypothetical protein
VRNSGCGIAEGDESEILALLAKLAKKRSLVNGQRKLAGKVAMAGSAA